MAKGQWEFQIFGKGSKQAADEMWIARYLLLRLCESYGVDVNFHCKPLGAEVDWNGSGMHANFSTEYLREVGGEEYFEALMAAFDEYKAEHIAVYGPDNHLRLTGLHETQSIDTFNYGVADRGASVRVPHSFVANGYRGYLEDRRPNSQGDPYKIAGRILETIVTVPTQRRRRERTGARSCEQGAGARSDASRQKSEPGGGRTPFATRLVEWRVSLAGRAAGGLQYDLWRGRRRPRRQAMTPHPTVHRPRERWGVFRGPSQEGSIRESGNVMKVEAVVVRDRVETVMEAVEEHTGHIGVTVIEAVGHGREKGITHEYRGRVFESRFLPKAHMTFVVRDEIAESVLAAIVDAARTGHSSGDGICWMSAVQSVTHNRTGMRLEEVESE